jgi:hypothetical protein
LATELWQAYSQNKQTYKELAERYSVSESTIKRRIQTVKENFECKNFPVGGVVLMDTTYFGRDWGVVVFKDASSEKKLWRKYVKHEKLIDYQEGIDFIQSNGYQVFGIVCDGLKGVFRQFSQYSVQMCQRHQIEIIRRYLTGNPKLEAGKELLLSKKMTQLSGNGFVSLFEAWENKWNDFLKEKNEERHYVHKKLRSVRLSIK